ncbi:VOC family protein [Oerskovia jenensis]|uniref:VOC family protein n=1 Tax=Oerskovia jenensis TaxID=162169 RepID=UPI0036D99163
MTTTTTPLPNRIGQVFIPVQDISAAAAWYSRLLGLPLGELTGSTIYDLPTLGEVGLFLDANRPSLATDGAPRFYWVVEDLGAVRTHLDALGVEVVGDVQDVGTESILHFRDPDGNLLMVSAPN